METSSHVPVILIKIIIIWDQAQQIENRCKQRNSHSADTAKISITFIITIMTMWQGRYPGAFSWKH